MRAKNSIGPSYANTGTYWSFTTGSLPGAFGKSAPVSGSTGLVVNPTLSWAASSGATSYEYCVDTSNDTFCGTSWVSTTSTSVTLSNLAYLTTYYWQVRARNTIGVTPANGDLYSTYWPFTTGVLPGAFGKFAPANGAVGLAINPTISWGVSSSASSYEYCLDITNDNACSNWISTTGTSVILADLNAFTTYYWQVRARNSTGSAYSNTSVYWSFTTGVLPGTFSKSAPANAATNQPLNPTLSWGTSTGAASYEYCFDITNDNACSNWVSAGASTSAALSGLSQNTTYYWQVRAKNSVGPFYANTGAYWSFTTVSPPGFFNKSAPTNGAIGQPSSLTLLWEPSAGATSYEVCYDTTNDNECSSWSNNGTATSKVLSGLSFNATYYWQVRSVNAGGATYANSNSYWSFITINAPTVLSIVRVSANPTKATSVIYTVTFSKPVTGVDKTDFVLVASGSLIQTVVSSVSGSGSTYTVTAATGSGSGTLRLDLTDNDSIKDAALIPLGGVGIATGNFTTGELYTVDKTNPIVAGIVRANASPTSASSVDFTVTFSEAVTGVDVNDFKLVVSGALVGTAITGVSGSGSIYTVTVNTGTSTNLGTLRLDLIANNTIKDAVLNILTTSFQTGLPYTVDKPPAVVSILRASPNPTRLASVKFTVKFTEIVTGVDILDFNLFPTGTLAGMSITSITGSGTTYTVTINTGTGSGTLRLDLIDNDTIKDASSNPLGGSGTLNGNYTIGQTYNVR